MAYQCHRCNHYTADSQKHECINDEVEELRNKLNHAVSVLKQIEIDTRNSSVCGHPGITCLECETTNEKLSNLLGEI